MNHNFLRSLQRGFRPADSKRQMVQNASPPAFPLLRFLRRNADGTLKGAHATSKLWIFQMETSKVIQNFAIRVILFATCSRPGFLFNCAMRAFTRRKIALKFADWYARQERASIAFRKKPGAPFGQQGSLPPAP